MNIQSSKKYLWKHLNNVIFTLELIQETNNIISFNCKNNILKLPDKNDSSVMNFKVNNKEEAEKIIGWYLNARNKKLKSKYYK